MRTLDEYLALITSEHRHKPKFAASLSTAVAPLADLQAFIGDIPRQFDLDVAIGVQLDVVGQWVGSNRFIPEPLPNLWFSFDVLSKGWDEGIWKGPYDLGDMLDRLDDETFRRLIRAKIMANNWDGTIPGAQAALDEFFIDPDTYVMVEDNANVATTQKWFSFDDVKRGFDGPAVWHVPGAIVSTLRELDMSVTIGVAGKIPPIVDLEIFAQNLIPLSIGGVDEDVKVVSVDGAQLFGFDLDNQYFGGFESGAWGVSPQFLVELIKENIPVPVRPHITTTGHRSMKFDTRTNSMYAGFL